MFAEPVLSPSHHHRGGAPILFSEVVATAGLLFVIVALVRTTSFANPAVTIGRTLTDTFAGIAPVSAPAFIAAQIVGGAIGTLVAVVVNPARQARVSADPSALVAGWEIYRVKGSPAARPGSRPATSSPATVSWDAPVVDGTPHPWGSARVWHLEPSLDDPGTAYAGVEDAGGSGQPTAGTVAGTARPARQRLRAVLAAGRRRDCLRTIILDPAQPGRMSDADRPAGIPAVLAPGAPTPWPRAGRR